MTPAEINRLIAEKVMGLKTSLNLHTEKWWVFQGDCELLYELPDYYHDERDCHRALEEMRKKGCLVTWTTWPGTDKHRVELVSGVGQDHDFWHSACAPTFPSAACEAMRQAIEELDHDD